MYKSTITNEYDAPTWRPSSLLLPKEDGHGGHWFSGAWYVLGRVLFQAHGVFT